MRKSWRGKRLYTRPYVGVTNFGNRSVFREVEEPTAKSHPHLAIVIGPFRTMRGAKFMLKHGLDNPHCRTVADAERLALAESIREYQSRQASLIQTGYEASKRSHGG